MTARIAFASLLVLALGRANAAAQAWLPDKGEATVSISVQNIFVKEHYLPTRPIDLGHITTNTMLVDTTYAATRRFAVDFSVPYVSSKYNGAYPHLPIAGFQSPAIDDGRYHATLQDLRFGVRYNLISGRLAITPFVSSIVPSHDYPFYAHSAVGRRLRELAVGTYAARLLDPVLPGVFVQGRYSYSFTQRMLDIPHNHSNAELELGYFLSPAVRVFSVAAAQVTHGGLDLTVDSFGDGIYTLERDFHHDQVDRGNYLNVGAGAAVSLNDSMDVFASFVKAAMARNGHAVNRGITIGVSWTRRPSGAASTRRQMGQRARDTLARCVCQKNQS